MGQMSSTNDSDTALPVDNSVYRAALNAASEAILISDSDRKILMANDAFLALFKIQKFEDFPGGIDDLLDRGGETASEK